MTAIVDQREREVGADLLTTPEAAQLTGIKVHDLIGAIRSGRLAAEKHGARYRISAEDLDAYTQTRARYPKRTQWAPDMDAALLELIRMCTYEQVAAYLGVKKTAINARLTRLKRLGIYDGIGPRPMAPYEVPSTGILIAKTCPHCGKLGPASNFHRQKAGYYETKCTPCLVKSKRERGRMPWQENDELLQEISYEHADRRGFEYTAEDDAVLSDTSRSDFDVAIELQRTYFGIKSRRYNIGVVSYRKKPKLPQSYWHINFPPAQAAIEEHFRSLGGPVPEEIWEWTDEAVAS